MEAVSSGPHLIGARGTSLFPIAAPRPETRFAPGIARILSVPLSGNRGAAKKPSEREGWGAGRDGARTLLCFVGCSFFWLAAWERRAEENRDTMNRGSLQVVSRPSKSSAEPKLNGASTDGRDDPLSSSWMPGKLSGCRQWLEVRKRDGACRQGAHLRSDHRKPMMRSATLVLMTLCGRDRLAVSEEATLLLCLYFTR